MTSRDTRCWREYRPWDAADETGFRRAMAGLGLLARRIFESGQLVKGEEFRFYLSGGFKAAIPYLIGLAEAVALHRQTAAP